MTDQRADLDAALGVALEKVFTAARAHLSAVRAAEGRVDDDEVWRAYVALNNAAYEYDELLLDAYGEVTPWDVDSIDPDQADREFGVGLDPETATDPHDRTVSVRQRRDYRVPSVAALLRVAEVARRLNTEEETAGVPLETVGEAVLELLQSGDGSLGALDIPELEPLDGMVAVVEVDAPLDVDAYGEEDADGPFRVADGQVVGRLDEHPFVEADEPRGGAG